MKINKIAASFVASITLFSVVACGSTSSDEEGTNTSNGGTSANNTQSDEADDVLKVTRTDERYLGTGVEVLVKNTSSKTSDYMIEITAESSNGKKALDSATVLIENVKPGQKADGDGLFLEVSKLPEDAVIEVGSVDRMESL